GVELAFFAAGPGVAGEHAPRAAAAGAAVIDVSSRFRLDPEIPLVVPEVNVGKLGEGRERGIVASPSGTATALGVVLGALAEAGLRRVVVSSYQGVASAGRRAVGALSQETIDLLNARGVRRRPRFARRIAFNCVPQVGALEPGGSTTHELLVVEELRKLLDLPGLGMSVTAVRVPIFFGSAFSVNLETESPLGAAGATAILQRAPGILLHDEPGGSYPTPAEVAGSDATHVGRVRDDPSAEPPGLMLWIALDDVRKGPLDLERLRRSRSALTPDGVAVRDIAVVDDAFGPRRHARSRVYEYRIWNAPAPSPFWRRHAWHVPLPLDVAAMEEAVAALAGEHDFAAFRGADAGPQRSTVRRVLETAVRADGPLLVYRIEATG